MIFQRKDVIVKTVISCTGVPVPIGPYSQAVTTGSLLYTSGQIPIDAQTGAILASGIEAQTRKVFEYLENILTSAGIDFTHVVKTTVFLKNFDDFAEMNKVYQSYFKEGSFPARSCVEVARLPKDALVEIEAIAVV
jgi:2-iminobutanoate/2-iminopropanoate deaminase